MPLYQSHPLADLFPLIEGAEFDELVASIKAHGLREPITLYNNTILDGRNRYRACDAALVEPRFEEFTGNDPFAFVADKNLHRRHLNPSQLGMIGARMATLDRGGDRRSEHFKVEISTLKIPTVVQAAEMLNVNRDTIFHAKRVLEDGTAEEIKAVERGEAAVSTIAKQIRNRVPEEKRYIKNTAAHDGRRANAKLWQELRSALEAINSMPQAADLARVVKHYGERTGIVDQHLAHAIDWLTEFQVSWNANKKDAA